MTKNIYSPRMLGGTISVARKRAGMTQQELADKANVSKAWIVRLEKSQSENLEMGRVFRVVRALGLVFNVVPEDKRSAAINAAVSERMK